jgi:hypothetical protein
MARAAKSSDRRPRLSQTNPNWTLFRGFRLSCAKNRSSKRTGARTSRRRQRSTTPRGMHGSGARGFVFFDFPTSSSSAVSRSSSSAFVRPCMRHERALRTAGCANAHPARRGGVWPAASTSAGLQERRSEHSPAFSCFPHPIRRASPDTFPASRRRGAQPPTIALGGWDA